MRETPEPTPVGGLSLADIEHQLMVETDDERRRELLKRLRELTRQTRPKAAEETR